MVVLNAVEILTAEENSIQVALGKTRAINMVHSYLVDTLNKILGVYKLLLIDLEAEKPTRANPVWDAERLSEEDPKGYAIV